MSQTDTLSQTRQRTETINQLREPPMFRVIYVNDDKTTMEFVISSLMQYFAYTAEAAHDITMLIHSQGSASVAVLPYELAEQKGIEVTQAARIAGFPLQIKLEAQQP